MRQRTSVRLAALHLPRWQRGGNFLKRPTAKTLKTPRLPKRSWGFRLTVNHGKIMRLRNLKRRTRRETGFDGHLDTQTPFRATEPTQLERLKERLLQELLAETADDLALNPAYRRAANDALSLAWVTPFPLLFLPVLFQEKAVEARRRAERQRTLLKRTAKWKSVA